MIERVLGRYFKINEGGGIIDIHQATEYYLYYLFSVVDRVYLGRRFKTNLAETQRRTMVLVRTRDGFFVGTG